MGTNFYLATKAGKPCECCGRFDPPQTLHIGKSSAGWTFKLRVYPDKGINDLDDWVKLLKTGSIHTEGHPWPDLTFEQMMNIIMVRENKIPPWERDPLPWVGPWAWYSSEEHYFSVNNAIKGPKGLLRLRLNGEGVLGHGAVGYGKGTWDLVAHEFS